MTTLSILPVRHHAALLDIYPNQTEPQACFIALNLCTGRMSAQTNPEIGNAVPMDVWHGLVRRYYVQGSPLAAVANALMEDIASHAQAILDHADVVWDGSNHVVHTHERNCDEEWQCDCPIAVAERAIEAVTSSVSEEDSVSWAEAGDWYDSSGVDEYVARVEAGESIEDVAAVMEQEIEEEYKNDPNEYWVIEGIETYLRRAVEAKAKGQEEE
jgi:hypothetical protein